MNEQSETGVIGKIVVLGTGGTIAGVSTTGDDRHYQAAQLSVAHLVAAVPALGECALEAHQVAQIDSKDMGWPVWRALLQALVTHLARPDVAAAVITHGTDTLEETALLLHLLLPAGKPVVLTAAMRPASSQQADGPGNLLDAVRVASDAAARGHEGVVVVMHGRIWAGAEVRKAHSWHVDAFDGGGAEPLGLVVDGQIQLSDRHWPSPRDWGLTTLPGALPRVAVVLSHADADGHLIDALSVVPQGGAPLAGLVVACTGHGTIHEHLQPALMRAQSQGVVIWRSSRVARGGIHQANGVEGWPAVAHVTAAQARLALSLALWRRPDLLTNPGSVISL